MTKTTVTYKDYGTKTVTYEAKNLRDALLKLPDHLYMGEIPHVENILNIKVQIGNCTYDLDRSTQEFIDYDNYLNAVVFVGNYENGAK